jgi:hypothetical protein
VCARGRKRSRVFFSLWSDFVEREEKGVGAQTQRERRVCLCDLAMCQGNERKGGREGGGGENRRDSVNNGAAQLRRFVLLSPPSLPSPFRCTEKLSTRSGGLCQRRAFPCRSPNIEATGREVSFSPLSPLKHLHSTDSVALVLGDDARAIFEVLSLYIVVHRHSGSVPRQKKKNRTHWIARWLHRGAEAGGREDKEESERERATRRHPPSLPPSRKQRLQLQTTDRQRGGCACGRCATCRLIQKTTSRL